MDDTPIIHQYKSIKKHHENHILFFRCGDFFEMFFQDGEKAAAILGITLTSRRNGPEKVPMCGVPVANRDFYIKKLIEHGCTVAICEQTEDGEQAKKRGAKLVDRRITEIYTWGTYLDESQADNNYILSLIRDEKGNIYAFYLDISTGDFFYERIKEDNLIHLLERVAPKEIITIANSDLALMKWEEITTFILYDACVPMDFSLEIKDFIKYSQEEEIKSLTILFQHIINTFNKIPHKAPKVGVHSRETTLDRYTIENLNLFTPKESFFNFLNGCHTSCGKRQLKHWLLKPLIDVNEIKSRQDLVKFFHHQGLVHKECFNSMEVYLKAIGDIQRNFFLLLKGKRNVHIIQNLLKGCGAAEDLLDLIKKEEKLPQLLLEKVYKYEKMNGYVGLEKVFIGEDVLFTSDFLKHLYGEHNLTELIDAIYEHRKEITHHIPNSKLNKNSIIGYYFEVSPKDVHLLKNLPMNYIIKQTLISGTRFTTDRLINLESNLSLLEEEQHRLRTNILEDFLQNIFQEEEKIIHLIEIIQLIDIGCNLAKIAFTHNYTCPAINTNGIISFQNGFHPLLAHKHNNFITNDLHMDQDRLLFITGPNMGGKSTFMRTTAFIVLLAQMGSFVPGENVSITPMHNIFVRIGFSDNEREGESTFYKEMKECANILNHCNEPKTLIFLDEMCRGTSYEEGMNLSYAIIDFLREKKVYVLLSSHYLALGKILEATEGVRTIHTSYKEEKDRLIFLYKMIPGVSDLSFGVKVAAMAGIPPSIINKAYKYLDNNKI